MANIKTYEAGEGRITPSEAGSAADLRSANVAREFSGQTGQIMRETGSILHQSFREVGSAVGSIVDKAQGYTDAQATLEANKDAANLDMDFSNQIDQMGKPTKDPDTGEVKTTSLADATQASADAHDRYAEAQQVIRDKMVAAGASQKALNAHDERALERQTMITHKMNAEVHALAGIEAQKNIEQLGNSSAALAAANPGNLDEINAGLQKDFANAVGQPGVLGKEAAKAMGEELDKAIRHNVTQAAESMARGGGDLNDPNTPLGQANELIKDPKYAKYIGTNIDAMQRRLLTVAREERAENRLKQAEGNKADKDAADNRFAKATQAGEDFDPKKDPHYLQPGGPEWAHTVQGMQRSNREEAVAANNPDPIKADQARDSLFNRLIVSGRAADNPDAAQKEADLAYSSQDGKPREINRQQHQELTAQIAGAARPENKQFNDDVRSFMTDYKATITGNLDPQKLSIAGGQAEYKVRKLILNEAEKVRQGLDPDTKDPRDLLDPDSKAFIGNSEKFKDALVTRPQIQQERAAARQRGADGTTAAKPVTLPEGPAGAKFLQDPANAGKYFRRPNGSLGQIPAAETPQVLRSQ